MYRELQKQVSRTRRSSSRRCAQWQKEHPFPTGSVHDVVDHIEHIIKVAGIDHVGLGSDYDGIGTVPRQLEDVSCYPYITQELLNRGYNGRRSTRFSAAMCCGRCGRRRRSRRRGNRRRDHVAKT